MVSEYDAVREWTEACEHSAMRSRMRREDARTVPPWWMVAGILLVFVLLAVLPVMAVVEFVR